MDYPRPQLRRDEWQCLDGTWQFYFDDACRHATPTEVPFDREIVVPYAPESALSGIGDSGFHPRVWYRRTVVLAAREPGSRIVLHFGAVDYAARVYVDGRFVGEHSGGHVPFSFDVTDFVKGTRFELALVADDDPFDMHKPRGKQDWRPDPHAIWYPRTTGIWRTVWLEQLPAEHIAKLEWRPDVPTWSIGMRLATNARSGFRARVVLRLGSRVLVHDETRVDGRVLERSFKLPDGGIDDVRDDWMWSPEHPQLIEATIELLDGNGATLDRVTSYTALRTVHTDGTRFMLNGRPYTLRMVLDQGYWPDGLMTADSARLKADVELIKRLGFNGARKHQKIEDPRWLYWCDVLGLAVWGELPSAYGFSVDTVTRLHDEWRAAIERDLSHPCIVAWVPVNESWGVPELPHDARQRALVRSLVEIAHALDGSRPVVGNDGWEIVAGDLVNIHDYHDDPAVIEARYRDADALAATLAHERPGRRAMLMPGFDPSNRPALLTEFGGIACMLDGKGWGYSTVSDGDALLERYAALLAAAHRCTALSGFCYTQLTDTFLEKNGLLTELRQPKADIDALAAATRGPQALPVRRSRPNPLGYNDRWLNKLATGRSG
jgi:beta-galactosidase/beta-glucuronidase